MAEDVIYDFKKRDVDRIKKPKGYQAPPMGYIIHYHYNLGSEPKDIFDNMNLISDYVFERLEYIEGHKDEPISSLEIEDIENQCYLLLRFVSGDKDVVDQLNDALYFIHKECYTKKSGYTFIDDIPDKDIHIKGTRFEVYRQRYRNRRTVEVIYDEMEESKIRMERELKNKKIVFGEQPTPENYIHAKDYITELIHQDIFRKEDLYDKVFKSTTYFGDYNKQYRKYKAFEDRVIQEILKLEEEEKQINEKQKTLDEELKVLMKKLKKKSKAMAMEEEQKVLEEKQKALDVEKTDLKKRQAKNKQYWMTYDELIQEKNK